MPIAIIGVSCNSSYCSLELLIIVVFGEGLGAPQSKCACDDELPKIVRERAHSLPLEKDAM
jgi:hypothetical protein